MWNSINYYRYYEFCVILNLCVCCRRRYRSCRIRSSTCGGIITSPAWGKGRTTISSCLTSTTSTGGRRLKASSSSCLDICSSSSSKDSSTQTAAGRDAESSKRSCTLYLKPAMGIFYWKSNQHKLRIKGPFQKSNLWTLFICRSNHCGSIMFYRYLLLKL